jgi:hypothetical protein
MQSGSQSEEPLWPSELYGPLGFSTSRLSIRLLRLKPGKPGSPIECGLFPTTLFSSPPFEALSYTWGDPSSRYPVYVNGIEVSITGNLEKALRTLRREDRVRVLWIDALCINQHDIAEKSGQVQEMGNIYRFADGVVVWLECYPGDQDLVMGMVQDSAVDSICSKLHSREIGLLERPSAAKLSAIRMRASRSLLNILDNLYWGRVWVVQEVSLARRDPTIAIGYGKEFKLSRLANTVEALNLDSRAAGRNFRTVLSIRDRTRTPPRLRDADTEPATSETARKHLGEDLLYLLDSTRHFKSTDSRDKIFALWTLVRGTSDHLFKPDYSMSMQQVYIAVTSEIVSWLGTLEVLMLCRASLNSDLPTWVPDYSMPPTPFLTMTSPVARESELSDAFVPPKTDSSNKNKLLVRGAAFDTISEVLSISSFIDLEGRERSSKGERALRKSKLDDVDKEIYRLQERNADYEHDDLIERREYLARMTENHKTMTGCEESSLTAVSQTQRQYAQAVIHFAHKVALYTVELGLVPPSDKQECYAKAVEIVRVARQSLGNPTLSEHLLSSPIYDDGNDHDAGVQGGDGVPLLVDDSIEHAWRIISLGTYMTFSDYFIQLDRKMRRELQNQVDSIFSAQIEIWRNENAYLTSAIKGLESMGIDWRLRLLNFARPPGDACKTCREEFVRDQREQLERYTMEHRPQRTTTAACEIAGITQNTWDAFDHFVQCIEYELRVLRKTCDAYAFGPPYVQLYRTASGLTGFGSKHLRVGDHVAVLDGLTEVCIIRKSEKPHAAPNEYTFHGTTFFNGAESATPEPRTLTRVPLVLV